MITAEGDEMGLLVWGMGEPGADKEGVELFEVADVGAAREEGDDGVGGGERGAGKRREERGGRH